MGVYLFIGTVRGESLGHTFSEIASFEVATEILSGL